MHYKDRDGDWEWGCILIIAKHICWAAEGKRQAVGGQIKSSLLYDDRKLITYEFRSNYTCLSVR